MSRPFPGVPETLAVLRRPATAPPSAPTSRSATHEVLRGMGLEALFDGYAGGDRFAVRKPDPGHLLNLVAELGAAPSARR